MSSVKSFLNVTSPTLLLDERRCKANIEKMMGKARSLGLLLRPHFKTHQSLEIGRWFKEVGISSITVSSVQLATYFYKDGWSDITIAFPINTLEWPQISKIASDIDLNVIVSSSASLPPLLKKHGVKLGVFVKLDVGTGRTGLMPQDSKVIDQTLTAIEDHPDYTFKGFLYHAGHTYDCRSRSCIEKIHQYAKSTVGRLMNHYRSKYPEIVVSGGDTPSCSLCVDWSKVDEIRPGNFVFYDLTQSQIGSCDLDDIAVVLACPIVAKHDDKKTIVIYGGGVHLSKDRVEWKDKTIYGLPVIISDNTWSLPDGESYVASLSQEHGIIQSSDQFFDKIAVGDVIGILPVHACMTANLMKSYQDLQTGRVIDRLNATN